MYNMHAPIISISRKAVNKLYETIHQSNTPNTFILNIGTSPWCPAVSWPAACRPAALVAAGRNTYYFQQLANVLSRGFIRKAINSDN